LPTTCGWRRTKPRRADAGAVATTDFRYQGQAIVEEKLTDALHPSGTVVRTYVTDDAGRVVKLVIPAGEPGAGTYLPVWNGHGDALALWRQEADGSLTLANSYTYTSWGRPTTATHNGSGDLGFRFLYVGASAVQWDAAFGLDLAYMHARHYSPALGRFLQPDPATAEANPYAYAENGPITKVDPDGTWTETDSVIVARRVAARAGCGWDQQAT
jgi:RHS repeat-associated protein